MSQPLSARLRRLWLNVHLWLGVGLLVVMAPLGLSGSVLVWHDPLDHALHAARYAVSGAAQRPVGDYALAAQAAFGARARLAQLRLPANADEPVVAVGRMPGAGGPGGRPRTLNAWIDPPTARVLDTAEVATGATMVLHRFHGTLLIPGVGRKVVGWLGWALFVSSATGLWLWVPRLGGIAGALRWRRGASQLYNLHHMVGFWLCLPLAALALTGVFISFPQTAQRLAGERPQPPRPPRAAPLLAAPALNPAQAADAALAVHPGARIAMLEWPQAGRAPAWRVELAGKAPALEVADATAAVVEARLRPGRPPIAGWMRGVHDGSRGGALWRWLITVTGLTPTLLGVSGLVMWLRRPRLCGAAAA